MRNLKKFLALVLAMMMVFSLMVTANAATSFEDDADINPAYAEAAQVLQALKIYEGEGDNKMNPKGTFNRAELATIAYRVGSGNTAADRGELYADYSPFVDLANYQWAAGYISYAWNSGWVHGEDDTHFNPGGKVSGYEVLALLLQIMGYGQNGEFLGPNWRRETARIAHDVGITAGLSDTTLYSTATREQVAELVFEAMLAPQVSWNTVTNRYVPRYVDIDVSTVTNTVVTVTPDISAGDFPYSLGFQWFGLFMSDPMAVDEWGTPGYMWYNLKTGIPYTYIEDEPVAGPYYDAVTECDVYYDIFPSRSSGSFRAVTYANGYMSNEDDTPEGNYTAKGWDGTYLYASTGVNAHGTDQIVSTQTVNTIGARGRQTTVYRNPNYTGGTFSATDPDTCPYIIIYVDTLLAKVEAVTEPVFDSLHGHLRTPATLTLTIYDGAYNYNTAKTSVLSDGRQDGIPLTSSNQTAGGANNVGTLVTVDHPSTGSWPYAMGDYVLVNAWQRNYSINNAANRGKVLTTTDLTCIGVLQKTEPMPGTQTLIWQNAAQHTVNGTLYYDNNRFHLDQAQNSSSSFDWLFDQHGNLIGAVQPTASYNYGVVTNIVWGSDYSTYTARTYADIQLMDGRVLTQQNIKSIDVWNGSTWVNDAQTEHTAAAYGQYNDALTTRTNGVTNYVSISTTAADNANASNSFVNKDLYRITENSDGSLKLDSIDVVGELAGATVYGAGSPIRQGVVSRSAGNTSMGSPDGQARTVWTNGNTQYLVRSGNRAPYTYTPVNGFNTITGCENATVDYAVVDSTGYARFVFVHSGTAPAATSGSLVYVKSSYANWTSGSPRVYSIQVCNVDGTDGVVQTLSQDIMTALTSSVGTLFYVTKTDGYVTDLTSVKCSEFGDEYVGGAWSSDYPVRVGTNLYAMLLHNAYLSGYALSDTPTATDRTVAFNVTDAETLTGNNLVQGRNENVYVVYSVSNTGYYKAVNIYVAGNARDNGLTINENYVTAGTQANPLILSGMPAMARTTSRSVHTGSTVNFIIAGSVGKNQVVIVTADKQDTPVLTIMGGIGEGGLVQSASLANVVVKGSNKGTFELYKDPDAEEDGDTPAEPPITSEDDLPEKTPTEVDGGDIEIEGDNGTIKSEPGRKEITIKIPVTATDLTGVNTEGAYLRLVLTDGTTVYHWDKPEGDEFGVKAATYIYMICPHELNDGANSQWVLGAHDATKEETAMAKDGAKNFLTDGTWTLTFQVIGSDSSVAKTLFSTDFTVNGHYTQAEHNPGAPADADD